MVAPLSHIPPPPIPAPVPYSVYELLPPVATTVPLCIVILSSPLPNTVAALVLCMPPPPIPAPKALHSLAEVVLPPPVAVNVDTFFIVHAVVATVPPVSVASLAELTLYIPPVPIPAPLAYI